MTDGGEYVTRVEGGLYAAHKSRVSAHGTASAAVCFECEWGEQESGDTARGREQLKELGDGLGEAGQVYVIRGWREKSEVNRAAGASYQCMR